jgi:hypothetical protein
MQGHCLCLWTLYCFVGLFGVRFCRRQRTSTLSYPFFSVVRTLPLLLLYFSLPGRSAAVMNPFADETMINSSTCIKPSPSIGSFHASDL